MQVVHVVSASGCGCWHCQRIAELVNVCLVMRENVARLENDLKIEREGTTMLLAENKRHAANALELACQLDQQRACYWSACEENDKRLKSARLDLAKARDDADFWENMASSGERCRDDAREISIGLVGALLLWCVLAAKFFGAW